ncbi:MAG: 50S ribosomal protein L9 [Candidatus Margulisiibacteriota bacterium]
MGAELEVIFVKDVKNVGKLGQRRKVRMGFAKNFLFPEGLALLVNKANLSYFESIRKKEEARREQLKGEAETLKTQLEGKEITLSATTHDEGKLYGSITKSEVAKQIEAAFSVSVDKNDLDMAEHIREIGTYTVRLVPHADVVISLTLNVNAA